MEENSAVKAALGNLRPALQPSMAPQEEMDQNFDLREGAFSVEQASSQGDHAATYRFRKAVGSYEKPGEATWPGRLEDAPHHSGVGKTTEQAEETTENVTNTFSCYH